MFDIHDDGTVAIDAYEVVAGALTQNGTRLKHLIGRLKSHRVLSKVVWHELSIRYFPYGSDVSVDFELSSEYLPYEQTSDRVTFDVHSGIGLFSGKKRGLLMPNDKLGQS
jgi:hypothetical protein